MFETAQILFNEDTPVTGLAPSGTAFRNKGISIRREGGEIRLHPVSAVGEGAAFIGIPQDRATVLSLMDGLLAAVGMNGLQDFVSFMLDELDPGVMTLADYEAALTAYAAEGYYLIRHCDTGDYLRFGSTNYPTFAAAADPGTFMMRGEAHAQAMLDEVLRFHPELHGKLEIVPNL